jgi:propanediol dehydratase small subunit
LREEERVPMSEERFTVEAAVDGNLSLSDLRMEPATLAHQAVVAEEGGNPQLAENFLRAAELALIDDEEVMQLYEALRPHRSTADELEALRVSLENRGASRCAELVRQAGVVYARRGLFR